METIRNTFSMRTLREMTTRESICEMLFNAGTAYSIISLMDIYRTGGEISNSGLALGITGAAMWAVRKLLRK